MKTVKDPYEILGVTPNSSDDEIKSAYRKLARKYHPDNYNESPLSDLAEEKMKEINEAYDTIVKMRREGSGRSGGYGYSSRGTGGKYSDIRNMILNGRLREAQEILERIPLKERDAEWYFVEGTVLYKRGWTEEAYTNFVRAHNMSPGNGEYRAALERMNMQRQGYYGGYNRNMSRPMGCSLCDICSSLICMDCCCECMGGDCIRCC